MTTKKSKKSKIKFGAPGVPEEKAIEALSTAFGSEAHVKGDPYEFTYAKMGEIRKDIQPGILINWGCNKVGFGQICLHTKEGVLEIDDECMSKEFVKSLLCYMVDDFYNKQEIK